MLTANFVSTGRYQNPLQHYQRSFWRFSKWLGFWRHLWIEHMRNASERMLCTGIEEALQLGASDE